MQSPDQNVERNRQLLLERSLVGLQKYGVTTERNDLTLNDWLQHLLEELLDAANYVQAAMNNAAPDAPAEYNSMHKGILLWILYHHQGGKCPIGQPIRRVLRIEQHAALTTEQVRHAVNVARLYGAPDILEAEPSSADTSPPTLCQTIHLGQPGVTVEPCLMLGPDEEEVACLLFTAPGTEVRLTWPTQTQALAVLAAATDDHCPEADAQPVTCECGDSYPPGSYGAGFIEGRGHCANCAAGAGEMASLLGVSPAPVVNQQLTTEPGPAVPLAARHYGMCISARGLLVRVGGHLKAGAREMLKHLDEMATRYYAGDIAVVDEFLQLYCLDEKRPAEQKEGQR